MSQDQKAEETPKRKAGPRRPKHEVAADYKRRALRIEWGGWRDAEGMLVDARALVEESVAAVGTDVDAETKGALDAAIAALNDAKVKVVARIPPEAR